MRKFKEALFIVGLGILFIPYLAACMAIIVTDEFLEKLHG